MRISTEVNAYEEMYKEMKQKGYKKVFKNGIVTFEREEENMEVLVLKHIGNDSWDRPVYEAPNGRLYKDVDPIQKNSPDLCTAYQNKFNGEPDTPITWMKDYKDTVLVLTPKRITWY